jgi:hypothetical protein
MLTRHSQIGTIGYLGGVMSVPEPFCFALSQLVCFTHEALCQPGQSIHIERTRLSLHDYARNDLVSRMRGDWLLMLDTDLTFEPDLAARLVRFLELRDLDVVTGCYGFKGEPHFPVAYLHEPKSDRHELIAQWDQKLDLVPVDSAGGGTLLIRRRVFERITRELHENPFDRYAGKGEDHSFFIRCRKLGIQPYWAPRCEAGHLAYYDVRPSRDYVAPDRVDHEFVRPEAPQAREFERSL